MTTLPTALSAQARRARLETAAREEYDLVIIGGGITGAGIAREAARRGLRVALLEAEDYASGTSSRSSKLIHGGLRYLAKAEMDLVRKTARERKAVHRIAPHLAASRTMVLPAASRTRYFTLRAAVSTYEKLGQVSPADKHENWDRRDLAKKEPLVDTDRFPFALAYREYLTDDARLVLANLRAAAGDGATILNRTRVTGVLRDGDRVCGVLARDALGDAEFAVRGRIVINAAGPWVEEVLRRENRRQEQMLTLTKGIHVVLPRQALPLAHTWVINAPDNRPIFAVPRGEVIYVGTTDTVYANPATVWPRITAPEVDYLLASIPTQFKVEAPKRQHILSAWAGLRALVAQPGKKPSEISRSEEVTVSPGGVITVAGGKLTGYRTVARSVLSLCSDRIEIPPETEAEPALPGGTFEGSVDGLARQLSASHGLDFQDAERLALLYGAETPLVLARGAERLHRATPVLAGEVEWALDAEDAQSLEDICYRRTRAALYTANGMMAVDAIADRMAARLGWDAARRQAEVTRVREQFARDLDFSEGPSLDGDDDYDRVLA